MQKFECPTIVDLTPDEIVGIIEERNRLKAALQKATAAFLYANGIQCDDLPHWDTLPEESYAVEGGIRSGRATYLAQATDDGWLEYWGVY